MALLEGKPVTPLGPTVDPLPYPVPTPIPSAEKDSGIITYLALFVIALFALLIIYRVCLKKILKKRRLKRLSEQGAGDVQYQEFASYTS
jgi:hypothetical protein